MRNSPKMVPVRNPHAIRAPLGGCVPCRHLLLRARVVNTLAIEIVRGGRPVGLPHGRGEIICCVRVTVVPLLTCAALAPWHPSHAGACMRARNRHKYAQGDAVWNDNPGANQWAHQTCLLTANRPEVTAHGRSRACLRDTPSASVLVLVWVRKGYDLRGVRCGPAGVRAQGHEGRNAGQPPQHPPQSRQTRRWASCARTNDATRPGPAAERTRMTRRTLRRGRPGGCPGPRKETNEGRNVGGGGCSAGHHHLWHRGVSVPVGTSGRARFGKGIVDIVCPSLYPPLSPLELYG